MMLKISSAFGVYRLMRRPASTNTVAISVEAMKFCRSSLILAVSSTFDRSS